MNLLSRSLLWEPTLAQESATVRDVHPSKITVLDGSMGRLLLNLGLPSADGLWSAVAFTDTQYYALVVDAHRQYIEAGADAITTNNYAVQPTYYQRVYGDATEQKIVDHTKVAVELAVQARRLANRPGVNILGCLPPLVESHRTDLTVEAYTELGEEYFRRYYELIARTMLPEVDVFLAETLNTEEEMRCVVDAVRGLERPIWICFAGAFRDETLQANPKRAAAVCEAILQLVRDGAQIEMLGFNCAPPEMISDALNAIPTELVRALKRAGVAFGAYANFHDCREAHDAGFDVRNGTKMKRRTLLDSTYLSFCRNWAKMGVTHIGGCCGTTPANILEIARNADDLDHCPPCDS